MPDLKEECRLYVSTCNPEDTKEEIEAKAKELEERISKIPDEITRRAWPRAKYISCVICERENEERRKRGEPEVKTKFRSLKCHLARAHKGTFEFQYRQLTNLPDDVPLACGEISRARKLNIANVNLKLSKRRA